MIEEQVGLGSGYRYLRFNVFNVALDLDARTVTVEDVLETSVECTVSLDSFMERVRSRAGRAE